MLFRSDGPGGAGNRAVRFFLESSDGEGLAAVLPRSGVSLRLNPKPVITEVDLAGADEAQVELGRCLLLHLTPAAGRDLYRLTVAHQGRRLALELDGAVIGAIGHGLVALVGIAAGDDAAGVRRMAEKTAAMRIFRDEDGRFDRSVAEVGGAVLVVSQFTLLADTRKDRKSTRLNSSH